MAYVYRHVRHDKNEPFYIGIGKTRYRYKEKQNRNPIWNRIVAKTTYDIEILFDDVTWEFACQKEIEFIKLYGRIDNGTGMLANMTNGGDGNLGLQHSEVAIAKISAASKGRKSYWKGKKLPDEVVEKIRKARTGKPIFKQRGKKISLESRNKMSVAKKGKGYGFQKGHLVSEEVRKKIGDANKGRICKEPWKCALPGEKNGMFGKKHSEESIRKNREAQKRKGVLKMDQNDVVLAEYNSIAEAALINNIFATGISASCRRQRGFLSYKGFKWKYKEAVQKEQPQTT